MALLLGTKMNEDEVIRDVHHKIDREKILINAANSMRQSTDNAAVLSRLDTQIKDGRRNIEYLQGRLRELEMRRISQDVSNTSVDPRSTGSLMGQNGPRQTERATSYRPQNREPFNRDPNLDNGSSGGGYNALSGGQGLMPPRAPYASGPPNSTQKVKSNYSKLGTGANNFY